MEYKCPYCNREFPTQASLSFHLHFCKNNPNKDVKKYICQYCGKEFLSQFALSNHETRCEKNPNRLVEEKIKCKYCGKYFSKKGIKYHEDRCEKNPNRINDALSKDEVLNKIKENYPEIELPYFDKEYVNTASKITCKLGNNTFIYSCGNLFRGTSHIGKLKRTNTLDKIKENYPGIELPYFDKEFNGINSSLITIIYNGITYNNISCAALYRKRLKLSFKTKRKSPEEIYSILINKYPGIESPNFFNECIGDGSCLKKKITCIYNGNTFYNCPINKLLGNYKFNVGYKKKTKEEIFNKINENYPGIKLPYFNDEYDENIDYSKNTITVLYNDHKFINVSVSKLYRKHYKLSIKDFNKKEHKEYKLSLLTKYDLEGMDWSVIIDLIGEDKLPKDFYCLCKFGPNTEGRKEQIKKLKEIYNIETEEEDEVEVENNDEVIENEVYDVDNYIYNENDEVFEDELKPYKDIEDIGSLINLTDEEIYSTGDKYQHIFSKEMSKLWGLILRDDENHSTKNIDIIKVKVNDSSITPFSKHIYEKFLKEYDEVMNIQIG